MDLFSQPPSPSERRVLTVGELNGAIEAALKDSFPAAVWVKGEVQRLQRNRSDHIYFELHGSDGSGIDQVRVAALKWDRDRFGLERYFDGSDPDVTIRESLEVCIQGRIHYHPKWGLSLQLTAVDAELTLGRLEARRRRILARLAETGLLDRNGALPMPELPLRVGLITSEGSAAEKDFLTGLRESGYGFRVRRADCRMTGDAMVDQVSTAVRALGRADVDVMVVTRGGGAKADLAWFDAPEICLAIAECPKPVITAIGHEIDQSLSDLVAHHHCKTPTAAAADLTTRVETAERRVEGAAAGVGEAAAAVLDDGRERLRRDARALGAAVTARVRGEGQQLVRLREGVARETVRRLRAEARDLDGRAPRLARALDARLVAERRAVGAVAARLDVRRLLASWPRRRADLGRAADRVARLAVARGAESARRLGHLEEKIRLLDPRRLLERGYSLTVDAVGVLVRGAADVSPGDRLRTLLRDGAIESIVERSEPHAEGDES